MGYVKEMFYTHTQLPPPPTLTLKPSSNSSNPGWRVSIHYASRLRRSSENPRPRTRCRVECRVRVLAAVSCCSRECPPPPATPAYLCLFYVTAPPAGEVTVQQRLRDEIRARLSALELQVSNSSTRPRRLHLKFCKKEINLKTDLTVGVTATVKKPKTANNITSFPFHRFSKRFLLLLYGQTFTPLMSNSWKEKPLKKG